MENLYEDNFTIFDLYIYSNCKYYKYDKKMLDSVELSKIPTKPIQEVCKTCIEGRDITFILGTPGLGKSSYSKVLFKDMLKSNLDIIPVHLQLKNFEYNQTFETTITEYLKGEIVNFEAAYFNEYPILLILDGFDELDMLAKGNLGDFFHSMLKFHNRHPKVKILITGRQSALVGLIDAVPKDSNVIILESFSDDQINDWLEKWVKLNSLDKAPLSADSIKNKNINDLVSQPLLLYLLCKMDKDGGINIDIGKMATWERWQFYIKLMDWTCGNAKWTEREELNLLRDRFGKDKLSLVVREVNRNIALHMFHTGERSITSTEVNEKGLFPEHLLNWKFSDSEKCNIINTSIVQSYLKPVQSNNSIENYAVEYLHKSFKEYFAAEALVEQLKNIEELKEDQDYLNSLATKVYRSFGGFLIDQDLCEFLFPLIENELDTRRIYSRLKDLYYNFYLDHKFLNDNACTILNEYFKKYSIKSNSKMMIECNVGYNLLEILSRLGNVVNEPFKVNREISFSDFRNTHLLCSSILGDVYGLTLNGSDFKEANLNNLAIKMADFSKSDFSYSWLSGSSLVGSTFLFTNLEGTDFEKADLTDVNFSNARMVNADLSNAKLVLANLLDADLTDANLFNADLTFASLEGANFKNANLKGAKIIREDVNKYIKELQKGENFDKIIIIEASNYINAKFGDALSEAAVTNESI